MDSLIWVYQCCVMLCKIKGFDPTFIPPFQPPTTSLAIKPNLEPDPVIIYYIMIRETRLNSSAKLSLLTSCHYNRVFILLSLSF